MGVKLVGEALAHVCPQLGRYHASRVALLLMARVAIDTDPEPWYGAGWQPIADALALTGTDRDRRARVGKVLVPLLDLGVIYINRREAPGRHTKYGLQLSRLRVVRAPETTPSEPVDNHSETHPEPVDNYLG